MTNPSLLRWRSDLQTTSTVDADGPCVHVEDPATGKFFRLGADEFLLLSRFDGRRSPREVVDDANRWLGSRAFDDRDVQTTIQWACQRRLLMAENAAPVSSGLAEPRHRLPSGSLLSIRLPLGCPDDWCAKVLPRVDWLFGKSAFVAWSILILWAMYETAVDWDRFVASSAEMLVPSNWLRLGLAWLALKVLHECAHALVCKRHGGTVREAGIALICFAPVAYVDVTSCWRFASRWPRIHTALAGMYAELACAALAVLLAGQLRSAEQQHFWNNVALLASVTTVLFNLNPLSKFDGYYVLTDLCGLTNLHARGRHAAARVLRRVLTGARSNSPLSPWLAVYGLATWLWSVAILCGVIVAASLYWHGLGLILAAIIAWNWLVPALGRAAQAIRQTRGSELVRVTFRATLACAAVGAVLVLAPLPFAPTAPGVVEFSPLVVVRADSGGFVTRVLVADGMSVVEGEPLLELRNEELERERLDLELEIKQSRWRERLAIERQDTAASQVEQQQRDALEQRLAERQQQVERLMLRAPISGVVLSRKLSLLPGSFVAEGTEVLSIGDPTQCEFIAAVSQEAVLSVPLTSDEPVFVQLHGRGEFAGRVQRLHPRATTIPDHLSLCAPFGGPLAVRTLSEEIEPLPASAPAMELLQPHVRLTIRLEAPANQLPRAGERGRVSWTRSQTCGDALWQSVRQACRL
jgi:putative peptide zinc metalloprotease protein